MLQGCNLRQTQNALSVLLARPPRPLPEMAAGRERIPQAGLTIVADMPVEMLRRRPDVRAAEMQLAAQSALIGVSVADLYPSIALLGSLGVSTTSLSVAPRKFDWAIGPSLVWNVFDFGRLSNEVLVQDARFQQLYEQYQGTVLQAAREVDDAAVGFVANRAQVPLLEESVQAAQRSLDIATIQYREGMAGFERVLDSQRARFNQQERLVNNLGNVAQSLVTLYKAMGGGWQQARGRPLMDNAARGTMAERRDWREMLAVHVRNNDAVQPGQTLFDIDPSQYRIALQSSRSDYESVQRSVNASAATVEAARASLQAAQANHVKADKDATRQETLYAEDPGAISVCRLEVAQATQIQARSQKKAAETDLRKAQEAAGESGDNVVMNLLGAGYIRLMSRLSYLY